MNWILIALLVVLASQAAQAQRTAEPPAAGAAPRSAEEQIRRLNTREVNALMHHDLRVLTSIWSDDMVVTNPVNRFVHRDQVVGLVKSGFIAFASYDRRVEYVRVYGTAAVAAGSETVVWAGSNPAAGKTSQLRFTSVWIQRGGQWREVARHANVVGGAQLAPPHFSAEDSDHVGAEARRAADAMVKLFVDSWNRADGAAYGENYWPDAELVDPSGVITNGRAAIVQEHVNLWAGIFKGSHQEAKVRRIRMLGPDHLVVDFDAHLSHIRQAPTGSPSDSARALHSHLKHVLVRRGGVWKIIAAQNTFFTPK
ncbi:MAG TPA: nuclear transport factor 2 family protein [Gemmatimonadaceae bacterium]|nr:nuclear transport factor 2 family protein [Gemmatimonadaceae bacterium]